MRIGIDIRPIVSKGTGVGSYTLNLIKNIGAIDYKNSYILFSNSFKDRVSLDSLNLPSNFKSKDFKVPNQILRTLWNYLYYPPMEAFTGDVDIFHSPHSIPIPVRKAKLIVTIHDLFFLKHPDIVDWDVRKDHKRLTNAYLSKVRKIITVSNNSKKDILELLDVNPDIITVIYEGVDNIFRVINDRASLDNIRKKYKLPQEFILFIGTVSPRKNPNGIIEAISILRKRGLRDIFLIMVGPKGWRADETFRLISENNLDESVKHLGYVPYEDMPYIYNISRLLVYPSLYEGFGLPPLEAMACGIPVISSNISSMPEILGDSALLIDPYNTYEIADSIEKLLFN
ncbi:MAG: glycosyltransferase family 4 protein [Nitrospirae bacterium]|nr:glycosyltransferase family 4 protein [Nitrospirota bacterium]